MTKKKAAPIPHNVPDWMVYDAMNRLENISGIIVMVRDNLRADKPNLYCAKDALDGTLDLILNICSELHEKLEENDKTA